MSIYIARFAKSKLVFSDNIVKGGVDKSIDNHVIIVKSCYLFFFFRIEFGTLYWNVLSSVLLVCNILLVRS